MWNENIRGRRWGRKEKGGSPWRSSSQKFWELGGRAEQSRASERSHSSGPPPGGPRRPAGCSFTPGLCVRSLERSKDKETDAKAREMRKNVPRSTCFLPYRLFFSSPQALKLPHLISSPSDLWFVSLAPVAFSGTCPVCAGAVPGCHSSRLQELLHSNLPSLPSPGHSPGPSVISHPGY